MAPIEGDLNESTLQATAGLAGYAASAVFLIALICYDVLYKSYIALPPSQDTRHRQSNREKHIRIHAGLATIALAASCYHAFSYTSLSYRVWAHDMGHQVPALRTLGWDTDSHYHIGRWWKDTRLLQDAWEIAIDRSRRYWWAQQHLLGTASWIIFVGVEGRRRNIRHLWAFVLLAHFLSLSLAINLFFMAVLLNPILVPTASARTGQNSQVRLTFLPDSINDAIAILRANLPPLPIYPHAREWLPSPYAYVPSILILQAATFLLPYTTRTSHFFTALAIVHIASDRLAYMNLCTPFAHGSTAYPSRSYAAVYRMTSIISLLLHIKSTAVAILDNDPGIYPSNHPHSRYLAVLRLPHEHERSPLTRSRLSMARVLTSLNDHPIVAMIGYDVLLVAFSLCTWAVLRGLNVEKVFYAAGITHVKPLTVADKADVAAIMRTSTLALSEAKSRRRKRKSSSNANASSSVTSEVDTPTPAASTGKENGDDDGAFQSSVPLSKVLIGEEEGQENLEAGAVSGALCFFGGLGVLVNGVLGAECEG